MMMIKFYTTLFVVVITFCSVLEARCEGIFKDFYKNYEFECGLAGGRLVFYISGDPKSFNPIVSQESTTNETIGHLFEGLTQVDPLTLEVIPSLAKKWQASKDGKVWIFNLREDVYFNDGKKFTAADVLFTFNNIVYNHDIPTGSRDILTIEGKEIKVEKIDDYTVKFTLPVVFAPFLRAVGRSILPEHVYGDIVRDKKFTFAMGLDSHPEDIVGTGAFMLKEYLPGERVILKKNPFYYRKDSCGNKLPYLDEIVFVILSNQDTAILKFLEGEIDFYGLRTQDISILGPLQKKENFSLYNAGPSRTSLFVTFNQNSGNNPQTNKPYVLPYKLKWFSDKRFRRAVAYSIDNKKIIDLIYNGLGVGLFSPVSPSNTYFYNSNIKGYEYDPEKAKELLKAMGFKDDDEDGFLEDSYGRDAEFTFFTNSDRIERVQIASLIKKDLENIGIKVHFLGLDFNNLVRKMTATLDWEMILMGLGGGALDPHFSKNVWSYGGNLHFWNKSGEARDAYEERINSIFNKAAKTLDEAKRKELYGQWQDIVSKELPLVYTPIPYSLYAVRNRFGNLYPTPLFGPFPEIERIYIKNNEQAN
jgi:peptide/nickel transport system substrate-binding protein